eukprot:NODE_2688_length_1517_cov_69.046628_g2315_i0.p1 GENE.NODE_2688_length_1517_cov_69.046628_g2315_i0~~NODE_2688_length_1517_cov_69.046628_g2315_i0.p1  ORF type:complete len:457 (+),score=92.61 NODE_2688_length_1517_cov_69.046628_g2315_i0:200-1372(+)
MASSSVIEANYLTSGALPSTKVSGRVLVENATLIYYLAPNQNRPSGEAVLIEYPSGSARGFFGQIRPGDAYTESTLPLNVLNVQFTDTKLVLRVSSPSPSVIASVSQVPILSPSPTTPKSGSAASVTTNSGWSWVATIIIILTCGVAYFICCCVLLLFISSRRRKKDKKREAASPDKPFPRFGDVLNGTIDIDPYELDGRVSGEMTPQKLFPSYDGTLASPVIIPRIEMDYSKSDPEFVNQRWPQNSPQEVILPIQDEILASSPMQLSADSIIVPSSPWWSPPIFNSPMTPLPLRVTFSPTAEIFPNTPLSITHIPQTLFEVPSGRSTPNPIVAMSPLMPLDSALVPYPNQSPLTAAIQSQVSSPRWRQSPHTAVEMEGSPWPPFTTADF